MMNDLTGELALKLKSNCIIEKERVLEKGFHTLPLITVAVVPVSPFHRFTVGLLFLLYRYSCCVISTFLLLYRSLQPLINHFGEIEKGREE